MTSPVRRYAMRSSARASAPIKTSIPSSRPCGPFIIGISFSRACFCFLEISFAMFGSYCRTNFRDNTSMSSLPNAGFTTRPAAQSIASMCERLLTA